ncbi:MAG: hypothetical protein FWD55_01870 [Propionibacteriaceae bacterium]|nr:hypothetical protein [Propionibacteriaceae bacterium]
MPPSPASLDFGKVFTLSFAIYKEKIKSFIPVGIIVMAVTFVITAITAVVSIFWISTGAVNDLDALLGAGFLWFVIVLTGVISLVSLTASWWAGLVCCALTDAHLLGEEITIRQATKNTAKSLVSLLPVGAGVVLVIMGVFALFSAWMISIIVSMDGPPDVIPLIIVQMAGFFLGFFLLVVLAMIASYFLNVKWFVAFPVMVSEQTTIIKGWKRSWAITKTAGGWILLIIILVGMAMGFVMSIPMIPTAFISFTGEQLGAAGAIVPSIVSYLITWAVLILVMPVMPIISQVVYRERLQRTPSLQV